MRVAYGCGRRICAMETNRREFAGLAAMVMGALAGLGGEARAQAQGSSGMPAGSAAPKQMKELASGVFKP